LNGGVTVPFLCLTIFLQEQSDSGRRAVDCALGKEKTMNHQKDTQGLPDQTHPCRGMCARPERRIFCGTILILIGLLWLGKKAGWFPPEFTEMVRPIVLVAAGILLVALALLTNKAGDRKGV